MPLKLHIHTADVIPFQPHGAAVDFAVDLDETPAQAVSEIDVRVDNKLGTASGDGSYDLTDVTISQPIPYKRLKKQQTYAQSRLDAANRLALVVPISMVLIFIMLFMTFKSMAQVGSL